MSANIAAHHARQGGAILKERAAALDALTIALNTIAADLPPQMFSASGAYAPGEKPYVALSSGPCATPAVAIERWMDRLMAFVSDNPGDVLWWRVRPTVDGEVDCETGEPVWRAYARLAMGNME